MKEQDCHCDKGGDRGSSYGMGKMKATPEGFSQGHIKKGHKKLATVPVMNKGNTRGADGNDSLKTVAP